jgi:hypothetical protein
MKYRILEYSNTDFDLITEDGGIASIYHNGDNFISNYYQTRLTEIDENEDIWEQLGEGKVYCKDWSQEDNKQSMINDALSWLVASSTPINWEIDNDLFIQILN